MKLLPSKLREEGFEIDRAKIAGVRGRAFSLEQWRVFYIAKDSDIYLPRVPYNGRGEENRS